MPCMPIAGSPTSLWTSPHSFFARPAHDAFPVAAELMGKSADRSITGKRGMREAVSLISDGEQASLGASGKRMKELA